MFRVVIDQQRCKGCGEEACTGCQMCALMCPDVCIEIYRVKAEAEVNA